VLVGTRKELMHYAGPATSGPPPDDSYRERAERTRRELYVGMTRARDGLWLGYLSTS
jgi:ATP-dependent exoDNAse (exonuclease V) beta subunit